VPWVPVVVFGLVRALQEKGAAGWFWVAVGMGGMWWGHAPEALFASVLVGAGGLVWLASGRPGRRALLATAGWAALAVLLVSYPILSYLTVTRSAGISAENFSGTHPGVVAHFVREAFFGTLLPLSDFQLGYALMALLVVVAVRAVRGGGRALRFLAAAAAGFYLLLVPVPWLNQWLWTVMPAAVRNASAGWAMNRLYVPVAALLVFAAALILASGERTRPGRWGPWIAVLAVAWAVFQVSPFWEISARTAFNPVLDPQRIRPENAMVTRNAYLIFPREPDDYSDGVVDPLLENRLLGRGDLRPLTGNLQAALAEARGEPPVAEVSFRIDAVSEGLELDRKLTLAPGRHYLLDFDFEKPEARGVLILAGGSFYRVYALPTYGAARSFGSAPGHSHALPVWTTASAPQTIAVRFLSLDDAGRPWELMPFASVRMAAYRPDELPVRIESWIPYRAQVLSPAAAWLETPRMYLSTYAATVDGRPAAVEDSPQGLAMIAVPRGRSQVLLELRAPWYLLAAFWGGVATGVVLIAAGLAALIRRGRTGSASSYGSGC
jgi:hypothetical protein